MLLNLSLKELRLKYKGSVFGFVWSLLNPLLTLVVYTVVFRTIMRIPIPNFPLFLLAGLLPWTFFQSSLVQAASSLVANGALIKKVYFAREVVPLSLILSNLVNFLITLLVLFAALAFSHVRIGPVIALIPLIVLLQFLFIAGFSLLMSSLTARFRDTAHLLEIILNAWMYATPIVYNLTLVPKNFRGVLQINPMTSFVEMYRNVTIYDRIPTLQSCGIAIAWTTGMLIVGVYVFKYLEYRVIDRI